MSNKSNQLAPIEGFEQLSTFTALLGKKPALVKHNKATGALYVPIPKIRSLLDRFTGGLWSFEVSETKITVNSITVTGHLSIFHPIAQIWIKRAGVGSVPIQQDRGASPDDMSAIKKDALHKNAPAAKSFALRNAAMEFGQIFGSNLNRPDDEQVNTFTDIYTPKQENKSNG